MREDERMVRELDEAPVLCGERRQPVHRRRVSPRRALERGLAAAAFLVLPGFKTHTAPTPRVGANAASSQPFASAAHREPVVVVGTGHPDLDVPAVQAAVDQGGDVILKGRFSFDGPPTIDVPFTIPRAMVLVWKAVTISGAVDENGVMTTIEAGSIPFYVHAPGQRVTIRGLRLLHPLTSGIRVSAVAGLEIDSCRIEGVNADGAFAEAIGIMTSNGPPNPTTNPGTPENVSGLLLITNNDLDVPTTTNRETTLGVVFFSVGVAGAEVEAHVSGNRITNTSEPAINLRRVVGRTYIEGNVLTTNFAPEPGQKNVIRVATLGSYLIAGNTIQCNWAQCVGISAFSPVAEWPMSDAIIEDNDINLSPPPNTVFGNFSAGIGVYGFAREIMVRRNIIKGTARAALSIPTPFPATGTPGVPMDIAFMNNSVAGFTGSLADIFVGDGALRTLIVGPGMVVDRGTGTIINP